MSLNKKINTDGGSALRNDGLAGLDALFGKPLPSGPNVPTPPKSDDPPSAGPKFSGTIILRKEKKGHGGKTVSVLTGKPTLLPDQAENLLARLKKDLGRGGRFHQGELVLQGEPSDQLRQILTQLGFQVKG